MVIESFLVLPTCVVNCTLLSPRFQFLKTPSSENYRAGVSLGYVNFEMGRLAIGKRHRRERKEGKEGGREGVPIHNRTN